MSVDLGMTVKETAALLGLPESSIYELCACGKLPHRRVGTRGRNIRITEGHVERYLASTEVDETNAPGVRKAPSPAKKTRRGGRDLSLRDDGKPFEFVK